jgi:DNA topoisomerase I
VRTYTGKWGKFQRQCVTDRKLSEIVEECAALPGYEVFKYVDEDGEIKDVKSRDLNAYVKEIMGPEFTAKDFRTWAGTLVAAVKLAELGAEEDLKKAEKNVVAAVDAVAIGSATLVPPPALRTSARASSTTTWRGQ